MKYKYSFLVNKQTHNYSRNCNDNLKNNSNLVNLFSIDVIMILK